MDRNLARSAIGLIAFLAVAGLCLPLVAGFFGWLHPGFDSFAHFRLHLAAMLALVGVVLVFVPTFRWQGAFAAILGIAAAATVTGWPIGLTSSQAARAPKDELHPI